MEYDPETLRTEDVRGYTPLHRAAGDSQIIKLILSHDLSLAKIQTRGEDWFGYDRLELPIHNACSRWIGRAQQTVDTIKKAVQVLFDAYPEGLFARSVNVNSGGEVSRGTPLETAHDTIRQQNRHQQENENVGNAITHFLEEQLEYAKMAKDHVVMTTPDSNGRLALHKALHEGAPHGSIKLLLKGNLVALQVADNSGKLPLHYACEYGSVDTVKLFVELSNEGALDVQDGNSNFPLHLACLGKDYKVAQFLLRRGASAVSKPNGDGKQPLHLLCEAETEKECEAEDGDSGASDNKTDGSDCDYVETVMMLLLANPEIVLSFTPLPPDTILRSGSVWKRTKMS